MKSDRSRMGGMKPARDKDVLLEIGTEELPATNLADLFEQKENPLELRLRKAFEDKRVPFRSCRVWATPRRLVFWVEAAAPCQTAKENKIKGPSKDVAYGPDGEPTDKLQGFLRSKNASLKDVTLEGAQGKEYVFVIQQEPVKKTEAVLPEIFEALVKSLNFPKTMRWDASGLYFPRPIRHLCCLYGDRALSFKLGSLTVSGTTVVFSKAKRTRLPASGTRAYFQALKRQGVLLDPAERKKRIQDVLAKMARSLGGRVYDDPFLLNEVSFLVERPEGLSAPFAEEFLKLPMEVLTVSMARKQRIFGVLDKEGRVIPRFLAVLDGRFTAADKKRISTNYEHILRAKLQDSLFFYREDTKVPLEKKREELKGLVFLKNAGSMLEKSERLARLAEKTAGPLGLSREDKASLLRAAALCKSDLLTQMVGEFPELQGVIGKYYALENQEPSAVAEAVGEHYLPRTAQDPLPRTLPGAVLSLLDKADLITACFALGLEPTSSLDPYGLRRSGTAVLKIILDRDLALSLTTLLADCREALGRYVPDARKAELPARLEDFFRDRLRSLLEDRGYRPDLVEAVAASGAEHPRAVFLKVQALSEIFQEPYFSEAWKVVERTSHILKGNGAGSASVDPALFREELEKRVFERYRQFHDPIAEAKKKGDFKHATNLYAKAFFDILSEFFDKVYVNAEDPQVRQNRLALLRSIKDLYTKDVADLSKILLGKS